jgi:hypothetical protein
MQTKSRYFDKSILHRRSFFDKSFLSGIFPAQKKELLDEQFFLLYKIDLTYSEPWRFLRLLQQLRLPWGCYIYNSVITRFI